MGGREAKGGGEENRGRFFFEGLERRGGERRGEEGAIPGTLGSNVAC